MLMLISVTLALVLVSYVNQKSFYLMVVVLLTFTQSCYGISLKRKSSLQKLSKDVGEPLILTPLIEQGLISEALEKSEVTYKEFALKNITSYSGYLTVDKTYNSNLFFWFFESKTNKDDPVVLWLQGGPGVSSLFALFTENGPFVVDKNLTLSYRDYSWTKNHSVLYIDNPAGTGFSFTNGGYAQNQTKVGEDLYEALIQFFTLFPNLQKNAFFITGESYGGHYIPAISYTILKKNPNAALKINLQGFAIGNPLSDAKNQADFGSYIYNLGLIDSNTKDDLDKQHVVFLKAIEKEDYSAARNSFNLIREIYQNASGIPNFFNHQEVKPQDPNYWEDYLTQDHIRPEIHVGNVPYGKTNDLVLNNLWEDKVVSVAPWIEELLSNYRVLFFNGQLDAIDPYPLMVNFIKNLNFSAKEEYRSAVRRIWYVDDEIAGYSKVAGNLTEVLVRAAGHMVPTYQPRWAYDLIYKFVRNIQLHN